MQMTAKADSEGFEGPCIKDLPSSARDPATCETGFVSTRVTTLREEIKSTTSFVVYPCFDLTFAVKACNRKNILTYSSLYNLKLY
jgi:hypothetical protein